MAEKETEHAAMLHAEREQTALAAHEAAQLRVKLLGHDRQQQQRRQLGAAEAGEAQERYAELYSELFDAL